MTLTEAVTILTKKFPSRLVIGYWIKNGDYVFSTKPIGGVKVLCASSYFVVTNGGKIYGTNPLRIDLDESDMKRFINR